MSLALALIAAGSPVTLDCSVETIDAFGIDRRTARVSFVIDDTRFTGAGVDDLTRLAGQKVSREQSGALLLTGHLDKFPGVAFEAHLGPLDQPSIVIDWVLIETTGKSGEESVQGSAGGTCAIAKGSHA